ncbi:MAG: Franean1_4349 family RiPP [Sphingomonadaceae bacterium]
MGPHKELERLIGAAIVDGEFRASLLESPLAAAAGFDLAEDELAVLDSAGADSLEELAAHIYAWITKATTPKRVTAARWSLDGHQAARIAV